MNKIRRVLIINTFLFLISMFVFSYNSQAKTANTLRELRQELSNLQAQKKSNENAKRMSEQEKIEKSQAIYNAYNEIEVAKGKIEEATIKIKESEDKIAEVTDETEELIRYMQIMNGENAYLEYIADSGSLTDMMMRLSAVDQISEYNREKLKGLENLIKENEQLKIDMANYQVQLNNNITSYENRIKNLDAKLIEIAEITDSIDDQIKNQKALIDYYVSYGCKEDEDLVKCVSIANNSGWLKPLSKGKVTSPFGYRSDPFTGKKKFHNGIDLAGISLGSPVYAVASGTVAGITRKSSCGGNIVYLHSYINGEAYTTYYAHLLDVKVKVGDAVTADMAVGTLGGGGATLKKNGGWDTCSTGAHLHFGVAKGFYLGGGKDGYSSYNTFLAKGINPPGFPAQGAWFYSRTQWFK